VKKGGSMRANNYGSGQIKNNDRFNKNICSKIITSLGYLSRRGKVEDKFVGFQIIHNDRGIRNMKSPGELK